MANNADDRNYRRKLKHFDEEEINRRLKAADLYDFNDTYETRKKIAQLLEEPAEETSKNFTCEPQSKTTLVSFENNFNIVGDEEDLEEPISSEENLCKGNKNPTYQKPSVYDSEEELETISKNKTHKVTSNKTLRTTNGYGSKMVAASLKNYLCSTDDEQPSTSHFIDLKRVKPFKLVEKEDTENDPFESILTPRGKGGSTLEKSPDNNEDDDFFTLSSDQDKLGNTRQDLSSSNAIRVPRVKAAAMKLKFKKYSQVLAQVETIRPNPLPDDYNFESKGSYEKLIENEERLKRVSQKSWSESGKWSRPILLNASNSRRRRLYFNPPSKRTSPIREVTQPTDVFEIIDNSSPVSSSRKLSVSPQSPVLESSLSRNKATVAISDEAASGTDSSFDIKTITNTRKESTQPCPICSKSFPKNEIIDHAAGCFSYDQEETLVEQRPRSERIAARSTRSRPNRGNESLPAGSGFQPAERGSSHAIVQSDCLDQGDTDSEFELSNSSGTKRNRKRDTSKGKKRRV